MTERRSRRVRKRVEYAKTDDDTDDDFADPTPPSSKKNIKVEEKAAQPKKMARQKKNMNSSKPVPEAAPKKKRSPLDEKLFERDLQTALQLSMQETQSQSNDGIMITSEEKPANIVHSTPRPEASDRLGVEDFQKSQSVMPSAIPPSSWDMHCGGVLANDEIEILGTVTCSDSDSSLPKRCTASRKRKFCTTTNDDTDDKDDFADPSPSSSKKNIKVEEKETQPKNMARQKKNMNSSKPVPEATPKKKRSPLDEKLFERDLQTALQLSMQKTPSQSCHGMTVTYEERPVNFLHSDIIVHCTPRPEASNRLGVEDFQKSQSVMPSAIPPSSRYMPGGSVLADDEIEFLGTVTCSDSDSSLPKRCTASRKRKSCTTTNDDTDDKGEEAADSIEVDTDADSDFNRHEGPSLCKAKYAKVSKIKLPAVKKTQQSPATKKAAPQHSDFRRSVRKAAALVKGTPVDRELAKCSPSGTTNMPNCQVSVSMLGTRHKSSIWKPHGQIMETTITASKSLTSPSSSLRLGLSRHARIKSLHPSLKVST